MDGENFMENPIRIDDLGGKTHYFWKHPHDRIGPLKIAR